MFRSITATTLMAVWLGGSPAPAASAPVQYRFGDLSIVEPEVTFVLPGFVTTETTLLPGDFLVSRSDPAVGNYSKIVLEPDCPPIYGRPSCDGISFFGPLYTTGPFAGQPEFITYWPFQDGAFTTPGTYFLPFFNVQVPLVVTDLNPPPTGVPEPHGVGLVGLGLVALIAVRRRRSRD